ncbi:hypothetical protein PQX77_018594 [Marasmius sp. AFHP31]|nr:hypothetical protein PQX77_018594 [Marasmius sp. AFHP31]
MSAPATETRKAKSRLAVLSSSIDELEEHLQPLLSQTLPETLLGLEPLQQAKLLTDIPYVVYDLAFIYLKTRGVDPKTHPVISELERVKTYFDKIKNAESPPQRTTQVDKAAASRFIQHAISQATSNPIAPSTSTPGASTSSSAPVPVKVTSKMRERAEYERQLKEGKDEEEEDDLQVFEDTAVPKRKRPAVDHFAGVGEEEPEAPSLATEVIKKQKLNPSASSTPVASSPAPSDAASKPEKKKKKTKPKKKKKGAEDGEDN